MGDFPFSLLKNGTGAVAAFNQFQNLPCGLAGGLDGVELGDVAESLAPLFATNPVLGHEVFRAALADANAEAGKLVIPFDVVGFAGGRVSSLIAIQGFSAACGAVGSPGLVVSCAKV